LFLPDFVFWMYSRPHFLANLDGWVLGSKITIL